MSCCHNIGEPDWKPHYVNVDANPNTVVITEQSIHKNITTPSDQNDATHYGELPVNSHKEAPGKDDLESIANLCKDFQSMDSSQFEWTYYNDGSKHGKRCHFDGQFLGNKISTDEIKLEYMMGTRFKPADPRGGMPCLAPGDKNYSVPEFSSCFHAKGSTLPAVNFSRAAECVADTFIPLQQLWNSPIATYSEKEKERLLNQEIEEVKALDDWSPAKPIAAGF